MNGHVLRGIFGGFFAGLFLSITLFIYGVIDFHSNLMWILPLVGIVVGLVFAAWAPFGSNTPQTSPQRDTSSNTDITAPTSESNDDTIEQGTVVAESDSDNDAPDPQT